MSKSHLRSIVYDALHRFQATPDIIKGFFMTLASHTFPANP